jgi:hypothetical protein
MAGGGLALAVALLVVSGAVLSAQPAQASKQDIVKQCRKVIAFFAFQATTIDGAPDTSSCSRRSCVCAGEAGAGSVRSPRHTACLS